MSRIGQFGIPGQSASIFSAAREIFWGGDASRIEILRLHSQIDEASVDAGAAVTSTLRAGLILGKTTSGGQLKQWDTAATDGSQWLHSVNEHELSTLSAYGGTRDLFAPTVVRAPLKAAALLIKGVALVGHADEFLARRSLARMGCVLDDDTQNVLSGANQRLVTKTATGAITAAENGSLFIVNGAGAVVLTLPAIQAGLIYSFLNIADQNVTVTSVAGDDIIILNDLSADSVAFSTASEKIGAQVTVRAEYVAGTLKWIQSAQLATASTAT